MQENFMTQRTSQQNKSLYKYFTEVSNECNNRGVDQKMIMDSLTGYKVPTTPESIKEMWKSIQFTMYGTTSTRDLESTHIDKIYDVMNLLFSEEFGVSQAFPSRESEAFNSLIQE